MRLNYEGLIPLLGGILAWGIVLGWVRQPNEIVRREKSSFFRIGGTAMIIGGLLQLFGFFGR